MDYDLSYQLIDIASMDAKEPEIHQRRVEKMSLYLHCRRIRSINLWTLKKYPEKLGT